MAKIDVTAFVHMANRHCCDYSKKEWVAETWCFKVAGDEDLIFIGEQFVSVEIPANFNPVPAQVAALEAQKLAALEKYQESVANINDRLSKLLALTNEVVKP